jgi:hypothetical protein
VLGDACWLRMRVDDTCWVVPIGLYFLDCISWIVFLGLYFLDCISCIVFLVPLLVPNYEQGLGINFGIRTHRIYLFCFYF